MGSTTLKGDHGSNCIGVSVVSCGDAAEVLQAAEHALDGVAGAVEDRREAVFPAPVGLGRDVGHCATLLHLTADRVAIVTLVAMEDAGGRHLLQQDRSRRAIRDVPAGKKKGDESAIAVGQRMDLGRAPAARATDGLVALPPFPPDAERCAFPRARF